MATEQKLLNRLLKSFTVSNSAIRSSTYAEDYRVRGYQRIHLDTDTLPSGLSYFVLDPTALADQDLFIFTVGIDVDVPGGPIKFAVYEDTDYVGTVALPYYNPERNSELSTYATIKAVATGADKGTFLYAFTVGASSVPAVADNQGSGSASDPTSLKRDLKYLIEVNNTSGGAVVANKIYFSWFEVPESEL